jgi:hypothetical protein
VKTGTIDKTEELKRMEDKELRQGSGIIGGELETL